MLLGTRMLLALYMNTCVFYKYTILIYANSILQAVLDMPEVDCPLERCDFRTADLDSVLAAALLTGPHDRTCTQTSSALPHGHLPV